jgi:hypothetical protein
LTASAGDAVTRIAPWSLPTIATPVRAIAARSFAVRTFSTR